MAYKDINHYNKQNIMLQKKSINYQLDFLGIIALSQT